MWESLAPFVGPLPDDPLARRSTAAVAQAVRVLGPLYDAWFSPDIRGYEHLEPSSGRGALVVGTHNGGNMAPDMFSLMIACWRVFGANFPSYGLAHDVVFKAPIVGDMISRLGAVPAHPKHATTLLQRGSTVLVYPGGDIDAFKPYDARHEVRFGKRTGFIKIALRTQVPIVPCVSVGAHQSWYVLADGRDFALRSGLKKLLRTEVFPLYLALPYGLGAGPFSAYLPLPSRLRLRLLPPIHLPHPPEAADDPAVVTALAEQVRQTMQTALDALVREGDFGPRAQLQKWLGR